jgi:hypothetical protein
MPFGAKRRAKMDDKQPGAKRDWLARRRLTSLMIIRRDTGGNLFLREIFRHISGE